MCVVQVEPQDPYSDMNLHKLSKLRLPYTVAAKSKPACSKMRVKRSRVFDNATVDTFESWLSSDAAKMVRIVERLCRC